MGIIFLVKNTNLGANLFKESIPHYVIIGGKCASKYLLRLNVKYKLIKPPGAILKFKYWTHSRTKHFGVQFSNGWAIALVPTI